jgi:hypothetical protein
VDEGGADYAELVDPCLDEQLRPKGDYVNLFEGGLLCVKN